MGFYFEACLRISSTVYRRFSKYTLIDIVKFVTPVWENRVISVRDAIKIPYANAEFHIRTSSIINPH